MRPGQAAMPGQALWTMRDLSLGWQGVPVLRGLSGEIVRGEWLAVVGPNGAGKSSLLRGLIGELQPLAGRLDGPGLPPAGLCFLPQAPGVDRSLPMAVADFASLGLWPRTGAWGRANRREQDRGIAEVLERVGLAGCGNRPIGALSEGQFRRLLFARAWLRDAPVMLLDEPFNALDESTTDALLDVLGCWHEEGRTVVVVLHDLARVRARVPRTLLLAGGAVAWGPTDQVLTPRHLAQAARTQAPAWDGGFGEAGGLRSVPVAA